jgi:hypothetical protein
MNEECVCGYSILFLDKEASIGDERNNSYGGVLGVTSVEKVKP